MQVKANEREHDILPEYLYRDFGFDIWNAMSRFISDYLDVHFACTLTDANANKTLVHNDIQLQNLLMEMYHPELAALPYVVICVRWAHFVFCSGQPPSFDSCASLAKFLTYVMFEGSAGHSAANFGQYEYYAFVPARPLYLSAVSCLLFRLFVMLL